MYYSEIFFKKNIYDIVEHDLIDFFSEEQEESAILEFKSGEVSLVKIYQEVAALHNSQGGLIIIGSPTPTKDSNGKESFNGPLTPSIHKHKDWLYQKISSHISPSPSELRIHDVKIQNGIIQIIDIPKSINPPHQCLHNGIYYLRYETETKFAPHGLVEALFNRRQESIANCELILSSSLTKRDKSQITLRFTNLSKIPLIGLHYSVSIENIANGKFYDNSQDQWVNLKYSFNSSSLQIVYYHVINKNELVLVDGMNYDFDYTILKIDEPFKISVSVWGSNMNLQKFFFILSPNDDKCFKLPIKDDTKNEVTFAINDIIEKAKIRNENIDTKGLLGLTAISYQNKNNI